MSLKRGEPPPVARHVSAQKPMSANVDDRHQAEPQWKDRYPEEHGESDEPNQAGATARECPRDEEACLHVPRPTSCGGLRARPMAGATAQWRARRAAAGPVPGGKGGSTAPLLLSSLISSCLGRALAARATLWPGSSSCDVCHDGSHPGPWCLRHEHSPALDRGALWDPGPAVDDWTVLGPLGEVDLQAPGMQPTERVVGDNLVDRLFESAMAITVNGVAGGALPYSGSSHGGTRSPLHLLQGLSVLPDDVTSPLDPGINLLDGGAKHPGWQIVHGFGTRSGSRPEDSQSASLRAIDQVELGYLYKVLYRAEVRHVLPNCAQEPANTTD
ncbi:hypothetical protein CYMTET_46531 [Cymbomonas tetramitiformis]|uniref:Uncharacterized protein n=1 Tax=Cymbomonas tetramitiformis TaxID=36881 RepID=A0AAE0BXK1_9CHLO|nr:hypothetical protein CYMTET_46531 [Cymbomonas tetramitiformis]